MQKTFHSAIRLAALMAAASTGMAIVVAPDAHEQQAVRRTTSAPPLQIIPDRYTTPYGEGPRLLEVETGHLKPFRLPEGTGIDLASVSPWEEGGKRQVVGVGWNRFGQGGSTRRNDIAIVRMSLPEGQILNRLSLSDDSLPSNRLCWIPGATASLVYAAWDGNIYRLDFESLRPNDTVESVADPRPVALAWHAPMPKGAHVFARDVAWLDDGQRGARVLATVCFKDRATGRYSDSQLWWLQLDAAGASIVAAGRMLEPASGEDIQQRRLPIVVSGHDSSDTLVYVALATGKTDYQLRAVPIRFNSSGIPQADEAESRVLATGCLPVPTASLNGQWLNALRRNGRTLQTERIALHTEVHAVARRPETERIAPRVGATGDQKFIALSDPP
jgi:hypothetical protein